MNSNELVVDIDAQSFTTEVIEASHNQLVMVDFWADWCGPCKSLGPILESLVSQYGGGLKLTKVDTDKHQELAGHFGIRSLPTVFFFKDGQPVDQFMGAQTESAIKEIIDRHGAVAQGNGLEQAEALYAAGQIDAAIPVLNQYILDNPSNDNAKVRLISWLMEQKRTEDATALMEAVSEEGRKLPEYKAIVAQLDFADSSEARADIDALTTQVDSDPENLDARFELANALIAQQQLEAGMDQLLEIIGRDMSFRDGEPRETMIKVFELCGGSGGIVSIYRRKLFSLLN
ncbi:MAG: thioredoxin [Pseudomonadota bacterium]